MCSSRFTPKRYHRIRVSTAKLCLRSCTRGRTVAVRTPMAMVISLNVLPTPLRVRVVPTLERKKAPERGLGQRRSRSAA
jgi:hypothetical protein